MTKWEQLEAPFPFSEIEVKVQTMKQDGTKALAIAYFDARAVRRRLNSVLGRGGWKAEYKHSAEGVICRLSVFIDDWHSMEDGADYTDIAKFKGGVSDAFKRAFAAQCNDSLYSTDLGWQECETYDSGGKKKFSKWTASALKAMEALYNKQVGINGAAAIVEAKKEPSSNGPGVDTVKRIVSEMNLTKTQFADFQKLPALKGRSWSTVLLSAHEEGCDNYDRLLEFVGGLKPVEGQELSDTIKEIFQVA